MVYEGLQWTRELPTEEGHYWTKFSAPDLPEMVLITADCSDGPLKVYEFGCDGVPLDEMEFDVFRMWMGPLPLPL